MLATASAGVAVDGCDAGAGGRDISPVGGENMTLGRGREEGIAMGAEGGGREKRGVDDGNEAATEVSLAREGGGGTMVASRDGAALDTRASCKQGVGMDRSCAEATSMDGIHGNIASLAILMSPKAASWWTAEL